MELTGAECVSCNGNGAEEYKLRVHRRSDMYRDMEVPLCEVCADEHLAVDWVEDYTTPEVGQNPSGDV